MSKNKKKKIAPLKPVYLSPENYIKTNARSLPIAECLINGDWKNMGVANIVVARRHKNGGITSGNFLVDLYCLGLKDTAYKFNLDAEDYDYLKEVYPDCEPCSYVLAHNIIYGAIAYAEEYGFKPHKDFSISQFILEEDDENVELMELEFGFEGKPLYVRGPYDDDAKISRIVSTLERTAGEGNFAVLEDDGFDDDEIMDGEFDDEMDEDEMEDFYVKEKAANFK